MPRHLFAKKVLASAAVALAMCGLLGVAIPAAAQVQTAVEYVSDTDPWDYGYGYGFTTYFVTSFPDEIAALDAGAFNWGWQRTGQTFNVWSGPASGALPTCRFYNTAVGSHFYTPNAAECAALQANPAEHWQYEGTAFYWQVRDENGNCPMGTTVLYRVYNNDNEFPIHRFTTSTIVFNHMLIAEGWISEGDSRTSAFACVPSSPSTSEP